MSRISVFGLGYVGSVSAACFAESGHKVTGVDINPEKVAAINAGRAPVYEPDLDHLVTSAVDSGELRAQEELGSVIEETDLSLICVGTPSDGDGAIDIRSIEKVCQEIGQGLATKQEYHVVVVRSTVLPGTVQEKLIPILEHHSARRAGVDFGVCMHPEFLREGTAVEDFFNPSLVVIGVEDKRAEEAVCALYDRLRPSVEITSIRTAEMVKYASNSYHALKVAFANEIGAISKANGIDGREVMQIFAQDHQLNISAAYLKPGFAFGGSCLPKDLRALLHRANELELKTPLLDAVLPSNEQHLERALDLVQATGRKNIGVVGLSFKANTDDVRESPTLELIKTLIQGGCAVRVFDPNIRFSRLIGANRSYLEQTLPDIRSMLVPSLDGLIEDSEVLILTNRDNQIKKISSLLGPNHVIVDFSGQDPMNGALPGEYKGIGW